MYLTKISILIIVCIFLPGGIVFGADVPSEQAEKIFSNYVDALKEARWDDARAMWDGAYVSAAGRLGVSYNNVPIKFDCASPLMRALDGLRKNQFFIDITEAAPVGDGGIRLAIELRQGRDIIPAQYFLKYDAENYRNDGEADLTFTSPYAIMTADWPIVETRFARIHYADKTRLNQYALDQLDQFVDSLMNLFGTSDERVAFIEKNKFDYYLCDDQQVKQLTGFSTVGMTDLAADAIVTQELPHFHELVHFILNYRLKEAPLFVAPFMQEGLATHLGGRWGRSARVMQYAGAALLGFDFVKLEEILTFSGFHLEVGSPDVTYPVAAIFTGYLIDNAGMPKFIDLYNSLSGTNDDIGAATLVNVKGKIAEITGEPWQTIADGFDSYWRQYEMAALEPGQSAEKGSNDIEFNDEKASFTINQGGDLIYVVARLGEGVHGAAVVFDAPSADGGGNSYSSYLFREHFPDAPYAGQEFGIKCSPDEAGIYNYFTNSLLANYVKSFNPSDSYWDEDERTVRFAIPLKYMGKVNPSAATAQIYTW